MRKLGFLIAAVTLVSAPALADPLPPGWSQRADGALTHEQSSAVCPASLGGMTRTQLDAKGPPDLGICSYASDNDREGLVRVRQYVRGAGETPLAIKNDAMLIEPPPGSPDIVSSFRVGPGPERNGAATQQTVLTKAHNGLLIDCVGRQLQSDDSKAASDFAIACSSQQAH